MHDTAFSHAVASQKPTVEGFVMASVPALLSAMDCGGTGWDWPSRLRSTSYDFLLDSLGFFQRGPLKI
jgi:hypothetical protein